LLVLEEKMWKNFFSESFPKSALNNQKNFQQAKPLQIQEKSGISPKFCSTETITKK